MRQLNLNVTEEFERDLRRFMRQKGITKQSEAIRQALREAVAKASSASQSDYRSWLGLGLKAPLNPKPRFGSEDDLWS
jgi:metal-responsive CopG/Arc/MetJ family transcriptional regulator